MATDRTEWLSSIKPGDKVAVFARTGYVILTVERVTKTQIVTGRERFRRIDGRNVGGDDWNIVQLEPVTESILSEVERLRLQHAVQTDTNCIDWKFMTIEQLSTMRDVVASLPKKGSTKW